MKIRTFICDTYLKFTQKLTDVQNTDRQKVILDTLFHNTSTADSLILFNKVTEAFNAEMDLKRADALEERRLIDAFFKQV